jgi:signal transduction histidine kinase
MSHALAVIRGHAELLRDALHKRGLPTAQLGAIIDQVECITGLFHQVLTGVRAPEQPLAPLDVQVPLSRALHRLAPRFRDAGITPSLALPADLPGVWGAAQPLEQVFHQVLVNAWQAMPTGGTVTIGGQVVDADTVQVTVRDTGTGITPADLARVFEPFYSTQGAHGTGLGVTVCQHILAHHCGAIAIDNTPGAGTTVTITLRRADTHAEDNQEVPAR